MGGFPSGPNPSFAYDLPWPAVSWTLPFSEKRPAIETIDTIETIEMIEMCWAPLAGDPLHMGARVGGRVGDIWDSGVWGSGGGYGICPWFGKISKQCDPGFVGRPPFLGHFFKISRAGLNIGGFPSAVDPRFAYGLPRSAVSSKHLFSRHGRPLK